MLRARTLERREGRHLKANVRLTNRVLFVKWQHKSNLAQLDGLNAGKTKLSFLPLWFLVYCCPCIFFSPPSPPPRFICLYQSVGMCIWWYSYRLQIIFINQIFACLHAKLFSYLKGNKRFWNHIYKDKEKKNQSFLGVNVDHFVETVQQYLFKIPTQCQFCFVRWRRIVGGGGGVYSLGHVQIQTRYFVQIRASLRSTSFSSLPRYSHEPPHCLLPGLYLWPSLFFCGVSCLHGNTPPP